MLLCSWKCDTNNLLIQISKTYGQYQNMNFEKSKAPEWGNVLVFLTLARLGTLTAAADKLKMAPSSISRHVEQLERDLKTVLFQRGSQGYVMTDAAQVIFNYAEAVEATMDDLIRQSGASLDATGTVRIAMPENFATDLVLPALPAFQSRHPDLRIEIVTSVRQANLTRREADMAIRLSKPKRGNFLVSRIGQMENRLFASQPYLSAYPFNPSNRGAGHSRIDWDDTLHDLPLAAWLDEVLPAAKSTLTATSLRSQVEAARAGLGIAALPVFMATGMICLGENKLVQDIFLIVHRDIRSVPRIDKTMEFIRKVFHDARHCLMDTAAD